MLSVTRQQQLLNGLDTLSKKVFAVVPIQEPWSLHKIINEVHKNGSSIQKNIINGILDTLTSIGLVQECEQNSFMRTQLRVHKERETTMSLALKQALPNEVIESPPTSVPLRPMDQLAALAAELRNQAKDLEASADRIEEMVLVLMQEQQSTSKETEEIARIRAAMKTLMGGL